MKGVSEIIAIILILMIVIALAALAYTWFSGVFASMTGTASTEVTSTTNEMATQFKIEAARYSGGSTSVTIRNIGTQSFNVSLAAAYIGGLPSTIGSFTPSGNIAQYGTSVLGGITNSTVACGNTITITIGTGLTDSKTIIC